MEVGRGWALLVLAAYPFVALKIRRRRVLTALLLLYAAAVIAVTILPIHVAPPSWRTGERWSDTLRLIPLLVPPVGFALNIVMFMPFGVLVPLVWPRLATTSRVLWSALAASAAIEFTQLGMWIAIGNRRYWDVNDLYSNTLGGVLGYLLLRVVLPTAFPSPPVREPDRVPASR